MLLPQKYAPNKIEEIAGNDEVKIRVRTWILNALRGIKQKPLLIHGPTGTGKTALAYALKNEFDLELIEMNASELRNKEAVEKVLAQAGGSFSLSGKNKLLLIDDVDALQGKDTGGTGAIVSVLKNSHIPILLTAENIWDKKLTGIKAESQALEFKRISKSSIRKVLVKIAEKEELKINEISLASIIENCSGDLRSAINDLQVGISGARDMEKDIFERMKNIFKSLTYKDARDAGAGDIQHDYLKLWIDENIPLEYEKTEDIAGAYNAFSYADIFDGRIMKRQYWGLLRYSNDLMTAGVALAKKQKYFKFVHYQFPNYLRQMSTSMAKRAILKTIGRKIGEKTHSGWKESLDYMDIIMHILDSNIQSKDFYQFDDEEAAFIFKIPIASIREKFNADSSNRITTKKKETEKKPKQKKTDVKKGILAEFL